MEKNKDLDLENLIKYAPFMLIILTFFLSFRFFVTPEQVEIKHREILKEVSEQYTTKEQSNDLKAQLNDMQQKIDKIYEKLIK